MTVREYVAECKKLEINPAKALDNQKIVQAIRANDKAEVTRLLKEVVA